MRVTHWLLACAILSAAGHATSQEIPREAQDRFDRAFAHMKEGEVAKAIPEYEAALRTAPDAKDIWLEYIVALRKGHRLQQSAKAGWRFLELDPSNDAGWGNLGNTFLEACAWKAAQTCFEEAVACAEDKAKSTRHLLNLGHRQCMAGEARAAVKVFAKAIELAPENGMAHVDAGLANAMLGRKRKAEDAIGEGIRLLEQQGGKQVEQPLMFARKLLRQLGQKDAEWPTSPPRYLQQLPRHLLSRADEETAAGLAVAEHVLHSVRVKDRLLCTLKAPEPWTLTIEGLDPMRPSAMVTLNFEPAEPGRFLLMLSPVKDPQPSRDLEPVVKRSGQAQLRGSVETTLELQKLRSRTVRGHYYSLQDKKLVGRKIPEGQYPFVTQGMLRSKDLLVTFTILTMDREATTIKPLMDVVESIAAKKAR